MRHHARDFRFFGRRVEHAALHEHRSARQRERVDVFQVHRRERVLVDRLLQFRRRRGDEAVANLREVLRDVLVLDDGVLLADFRRGFLSELHVLLRRVLFLRKLDHRLRRQARCKFLQDGGRNLPIASLAPERHIGIDRRGAAGGQVAGEKRGAD